MGFPLLPKWIIPALTELTPEQLKERGIQLIMLDFDNTIVPYTTNVPTPAMEAVLQNLQASGIRVCVVSNSKRDRVRAFCRERGIDCITHAKKPFGKGIRACMEKYGLAPGGCALAGDQIFTDTLGANLAGVTSILVTPIHNHNIWLKLRHVAEKPFIYLAKGRLNK
ncbi:MAG: YqeG family HAD IIIA-type phosphatase [Ruminococcaceae bacterium]|nr:YqeG family HAD IIIA-type phosphatase [Oscillospiraceae bacterium]